MHLQVPDCCGCCLVSVPVSQTLSLQPNSPPISSTAWSRLSESLSLCIPPSLSLCVCLLIFFCHLFSSNVCQSSYLRACARYGARRPKRITYTRAFIASSARSRPFPAMRARTLRYAPQKIYTSLLRMATGFRVQLPLRY